jgi:signal transduction histidine kinase
MRLSIATKVFVAFALVVAIFTGVLMFGVYRTQTLFTQIERINRRIVPVSLSLSDAQTDLKSFNILLNERDPLVVRRTLQMARLVKSLPDQIRQQLGRAAELIQSKERDQVFGERQSRTLSGIEADLQALERRAREFADRAETFTQRVLRNSDQELDKSELTQLQARLRSDVRHLDDRITVLRNDLRRMTDQGLERANENEQSSLWALVGLSAGALLLSAGVLAAVLRIIQPLTTLTEATKRVGEGDYRPLEDPPEPWLGADEITMLSREFNAMAEKLARRDAKLREQHEALLKSERLATVGRMTSVITHELRNPLSSINLNTEMLMESLVEEHGIDRDDPDVMPLLRTITDEVERLRDITEEYLVYARLPTADLEDVDMVDIVENLVDFHLGEWERSGVEVEVDWPDGSLPLRADPDHLRQALLNVVKNAIEISPEGSVVRIGMEGDDESVQVWVRDYGPGLEDDPDELFEPFYTTKPDGTGLGLPMTQQMVEEHHGSIDVEQPDGGGTRFALTLPRDPEDELDPETMDDMLTPDPPAAD